jgi:transposase
MMGSNDKRQDELFYAFNLDDVVPQDRLLRSIDRVLDLSGLREQLAPYYSHTGRPSIDPELMIRMMLIGYCLGIRSDRLLCEEVNPELMIRMMLIGYCLGIRSDRLLCEEVKLNLAYRWFCRLKITDPVPDHSTFSKNRNGRFRESDALRFVFEEVLKRCMEEGLIGGEGFAVDASVVKADASKQTHHDDDDDWGDGSRAIDEYLEALEKDGDKLTPAKRVSQTDPMARWTAAPGGPAYYAYSTNYLVDTEVGGLETRTLIGDTAYGTAEFLNWMVNEKGIEPHVPVWDKGEQDDGTFSRSDFVFDEANDRYTCPNGKALRRFWRNYTVPRTGITQSGEIKYRSRKTDCAACPMKQQCCPNTEIRTVTRSIYEPARDVARAVRKTPAYRRTRRQRKQVEMLFAHMKRILKMDRLRLRGLSGAHDEFLLTATAQNLRRMAKTLGTGPPKIREMAVT